MTPDFTCTHTQCRLTWIIKAWSSWIQKEIKIHIRERKKKKNWNLLHLILFWYEKWFIQTLTLLCLKKCEFIDFFPRFHFLCLFVCQFNVWVRLSSYSTKLAVIYGESRLALSWWKNFFFLFSRAKHPTSSFIQEKKKSKASVWVWLKALFLLLLSLNFFCYRVKEHVCGYKKVLPFYLFFLNENLVV